jgi:hypothetical protein
MKTPTISFLFFIIILFSSCFPSDVRFIDAQPEHLEELSFIPNQFQGIFVINDDTVVVTDCTINGDSINSDSLVVKSWGNYLFVNFLENGIYKLGCAKVVNAWNNQNISLEYFRFFDELPINESASLDEAEKLQLQEMIADKHNPLVDIDSTDDLHFILDNISINHFQSLLNNAKSEEVIRIE